MKKYVLITLVMALSVAMMAQNRSSLSASEGTLGTFDSPERALDCPVDAYGDQAYDIANAITAYTSDADLAFLVADRFQVPATVDVGGLCFGGVNLDFDILMSVHQLQPLR